MNKERVLNVISLVNIATMMGFGAVSIYFSYKIELDDSVSGFLLGLGITLLVLAPIVFSKKGLFYKMMAKYDERQFFIQIITMYIMILLLAFMGARLAIQYIAVGEVSILQLNIKLIVLIITKIFAKRTLNNYL